MNKIYKIHGAVQHYAWGGCEYIPTLIGEKNTALKPYAELWLGAHPKAPAMVVSDGSPLALSDLLSAKPELLGKRVQKKFGRLPFLFKVLDAHDMLSIQVHPSKAQAEKGFAHENAAGIDLSAVNRSYKDDNHKPEVHVALTDFWMLHSFRPEHEIENILNTVPEFHSLQPFFADGGTQALYTHIMQLPQKKIDELLNPLYERLRAENPANMDQPDYWAMQAFENFPLENNSRDRGVFSIYLFNLLHLKPGQGTFQAAGIPHAYLRGVNMELMANSDNVLRGGLTPKFIDVDELLKTVVFKGEHPNILNGDPKGAETIYRTPSPEFELSKIAITENARFTATGPEIWIALHGAFEINGISFKKGEAFFAAAGTTFTIDSTSDGILFRAAVPV